MKVILTTTVMSTVQTWRCLRLISEEPIVPKERRMARTFNQTIQGIESVYIKLRFNLCF